MDKSTKSELGQISILVLATAIAFLLGTIAVGMVAEIIVAQQRLNAKAEAIALAGALELEFDQEQACVTVQEFGTTNFGTNAQCVADSASIEILLSEPNPNRIFSVFMPNIQASSRAGIASDD